MRGWELGNVGGKKKKGRRKGKKKRQIKNRQVKDVSMMLEQRIAHSEELFRGFKIKGKS